MELTWYGRTCIRLQGRDAVVVGDAYPSVVGPTGRGITGDIVTYSHPDDKPLAKAKGRRPRDGGRSCRSSLDDAFVLDGPGEYEVQHVLLTGVRTYRDDARGAERGRQTAFVVELDEMHTIHLGDIGHLLTEEKLGDIGPVDIACVPIGGALTATRAAELDRPARSADRRADAGLRRRGRLRRGAGALLPRDGRPRQPAPQAKLTITISELARRDDDGPAGVARQGLTAADSSGRRARLLALEDGRPRLTTVRDEVGARPVRDLVGRRHAPDDEVGLLAGLDRADVVAEPSACAALIVTAASASAGVILQLAGRRSSSPAAGSPSVTCPG